MRRFTQFAIDVAERLIARWRSTRSSGFLFGSLTGALGYVLVGFWFLLVLIAILAGLVIWALRRALL